DEGIAKFADKIEEGWTTSTGRFVDRKEAAHIAGMGDAGGEFHAVPHFEDYQAKAERDAANVEANLRTLWEERGIHPAEALHEADRDAWFKNELMQPPRGEDTTAASVHEDVYGQLKATGMSDEEASANAAVMAARYATRAQRLGGEKSALEMYQGEGLS